MCYILVGYVLCPGCVGLKCKSLHGTIAEHVKRGSEERSGVFQCWSNRAQSLKLEAMPGRAVPTDGASPGAVLNNIPKHAWGGLRGWAGTPELAVALAWGGSETVVTGAKLAPPSCSSDTDAWAGKNWTSPLPQPAAWTPKPHTQQTGDTAVFWSCRSQPPSSQPFTQVSVDISTVSDKLRSRPTFKTQPIPLLMWFLLTRRGALDGAPEPSGSGKPQPTWSHDLGLVSCLSGQERLGTGRDQPS